MAIRGYENVLLTSLMYTSQSDTKIPYTIRIETRNPVVGQTQDKKSPYTFPYQFVRAAMLEDRHEHSSLPAYSSRPENSIQRLDLCVSIGASEILIISGLHRDSYSYLTKRQGHPSSFAISCVQNMNLED